MQVCLSEWRLVASFALLPLDTSPLLPFLFSPPLVFPLANSSHGLSCTAFTHENSDYLVNNLVAHPVGSGGSVRLSRLDTVGGGSGGMSEAMPAWSNKLALA